MREYIDDFILKCLNTATFAESLRKHGLYAGDFVLVPLIDNWSFTLDDEFIMGDMLNTDHWSGSTSSGMVGPVFATDWEKWALTIDGLVELGTPLRI